MKNSTVPSAMGESFRRWASAEMDGRPVRLFTRFFTAVWLAYDILDVALGGTAATRWSFPDPGWSRGLLAIQLGLIVSESALLAGFPARGALLAAAILRASEALFFFPLNDFYYAALTAFLLLPFRHQARDWAWPRDLLLWQAAWMYFCTALWKLNPVWLSGGHLFVRHGYLAAALHWPYPVFYARFVSTLGGNAVLAGLAVLGEFILAVLLARRGPRRWIVVLAAAVHGYAAAALNVWFFGLSMVAQVAFLTPFPARESK